MRSGVPESFFREVFFKQEPVKDEFLEKRPEDELFEELRKLASTPQEKPTGISFTRPDPELVKVAKLAIFFDTLDLLYK